MIVKDEEDTIAKCLKAVAPYISYWVIVDTGSKDNTISVINQTMNELGIPGELHERSWVNFEVNRTESLKLAKGKCDYRWIIDADDTFFPENPNVNPFAGLDKKPDGYQILYKLNALQYHRVQIVKSDQDWVYKGVLHEYLHLEKPEIIQGIVPHAYVVADISPLKRANTLEEKYANDAKILEEALINEPNNTRYQFYLAQSYRDSAQHEKSIEAYAKRVDMGEWAEEVYYSMYMIAKIKERTGASVEEVSDLYLRAWEYRPERLEALFHAMRKLREQKRFILAFAVGDVGIKTRGTGDILFVEPEIWQWRLLDEYSLSSYYIGNPEIALEKTGAILKAPFFESLPPEEKNRLKKNMDFYKKGADEKMKKIKQMEAMQKAQQNSR
jgi:glycosyltransferase involved in cell wall biosynthesis